MGREPAGQFKIVTIVLNYTCDFSLRDLDPDKIEVGSTQRLSAVIGTATSAFGAFAKDSSIDSAVRLVATNSAKKFSCQYSGTDTRSYPSGQRIKDQSTPFNGSEPFYALVIPFKDAALAEKVSRAFHDAVILAGGKKSAKDIY